MVEASTGGKLQGPRASVGVIIVTYNSGSLIESCLEALVALSADQILDVVVVDNDSTDDVAELARGHRSRPTVVETGRNGGYAAGVNVGLTYLAEHSAVLILNPDCRLHAGALSHLIQALEDNGVGVAGPRMRDASGTVAWSIFREPTIVRALGSAIGGRRAGGYKRFGEQQTQPSAYEDDHDVDWLSGAALLVSRRCIDEVGSWDESFFLYSEETDFQMRATRAGHRVRYVASAAVTHDGGDSPVSPSLWSLLTVNRIRLYRKYHGPISTEIYRLAVMLGEFGRVLRGRKPSQAAIVALFSPKRRRFLHSSGTN